MKFPKDIRGSTTLEFGLVILAVVWFIFGIIQTGWIVWMDNMLYLSVDTAARCGAVHSTTPPCHGADVSPSVTNMRMTANRVFGMTGATFINNATCSGNGGTGLVGTYQVTFVSVVNMTLTAKSCYPT
jgi:Flp pilus assembly protein TadG